MLDRSRKRPRDPNQLAKFVVDAATGEKQDTGSTADQGSKNLAAVALGRLGGLKGGRARADSMSKKQRSEIAKLAAEARWGKRSGHD